MKAAYPKTVGVEDHHEVVAVARRIGGHDAVGRLLLGDLPQVATLQGMVAEDRIVSQARVEGGREAPVYPRLRVGLVSRIVPT